jgi:hypothetical protein
MTRYLLACVLLLAACSREAAVPATAPAPAVPPVLPPSTAPAAEGDAPGPANAVAEPPLAATQVITTEAVEDGSMPLEKATAGDLEYFLNDLRSRRQVDADAHHGQPGPDAAFLNRYIDKVTAELVRRGYTVDGAGELHRPAKVGAGGTP